MDLVDINLPEEPGRYRISGVAKLDYSVDEIYVEYGDPDWDDVDPSQSYITDYADVDYDPKSSWIENLQVEKL